VIKLSVAAWPIMADKTVYKECVMKKMIVRFANNESGATAIEYGLIAAGIAVAIVVVLGTVGLNLTATFQSVADNL
jgi:pilus assembly protein Flp/PilA